MDGATQGDGAGGWELLSWMVGATAGLGSGEGLPTAVLLEVLGTRSQAQAHPESIEPPGPNFHGDGEI